MDSQHGDWALHFGHQSSVGLPRSSASADLCGLDDRSRSSLCHWMVHRRSGFSTYRRKHLYEIRSRINSTGSGVLVPRIHDFAWPGFCVAFRVFRSAAGPNGSRAVARWQIWGDPLDDKCTH